MTAQTRKDPLETATFVHSVSTHSGPATKASQTGKKILAIAGLALAAGCGGAVAYHASVRGEQAPSPLLRQDLKSMNLMEMSSSSAFDTLLTGSPFMMRIVGTDVCVDDGTSTSDNNMVLQKCDGTNMNQIFRYESASDTIYSAYKRGMCVDDGGATEAGKSTIGLRSCNSRSPNQNWAYDTDSKLFHSSQKLTLCMDGGGSLDPGQTDMHVWTCDVSNRNQQLEIIVPDEVTSPFNMQISLHQRDFSIYLMDKPGYCLDVIRDPRWQWEAKPCDANALTQRFRFNEGSGQIQSVQYGDRCVDDAGTTDSRPVISQLAFCSPSNRNQRFTFDLANMHIVSTTNNLCVTGTEFTRFKTIPMTLDHCASGGTNRFKIMYTKPN